MREINSSSTSTGTRDKTAGCNISILFLFFLKHPLKSFIVHLLGESTSESSDEPLIKMAKKTPKVTPKRNSVPPKKSVDTKREGILLSTYLWRFLWYLVYCWIFLTQNQQVQIAQTMSHWVNLLRNLIQNLRHSFTSHHPKQQTHQWGPEEKGAQTWIWVSTEIQTKPFLLKHQN